MKASEIGLPQELDALDLNWEQSGVFGVLAAGFLCRHLGDLLASGDLEVPGA